MQHTLFNVSYVVQNPPLKLSKSRSHNKGDKAYLKLLEGGQGSFKQCL
ncbi:hypothetical protein Hanom_Chr05g00475831 [Helianthus anomalus]